MSDMLGQIGIALLAASRATSDVENAARSLDERYGQPHLCALYDVWRGWA
ncbi:MAG: hypothetical protein ACK5IN_01725 [Microbacterium sp.]